MRAPALFRAATLAAALAVTATRAHAAATITIVNLDGAGEGFNDPTPAAPVGGNPGTTIGQQRLNVFQAAANLWGATLTSTVPIRVGSKFDPLSCTATSAVLGSAGPAFVAHDFPGAELGSTYYHIALANKMAGSDLAGGANQINATFNSNLGQAGCLTGVPFYYGLDHNEGGLIDLLAVVQHELGHGLGFSTLVNSTTGALFSGLPDAYARRLYDDSAGLHWDAMSDAQRAASAINPGRVAWDGVAVRTRAPLFLGSRRAVVVNSPAGLAGSMTSGQCGFGAVLDATGVTGAVVLGDDGSAPTSDGCTALVNAGAVAGKICLLDRGACNYNVKAQAAQNAGAIGVIIVNNANATAPDMGGTAPGVTIPVTSLSYADGNAIRAALAGGVDVTLKLDAAHLQGADDAGRVFVYTPNPVQSGSSVSHWDVIATPNLLMEPAINADLTGLDLTRDAFEDIGWFPHTTGVPAGGPSPTRLAAAAPNPFARSTTIAFTLERPMSVTVDVYDLSGRLVRRLASLPLAYGAQSVSWDGRDAGGRSAGPGIYLCRLNAGGRSESRRMALVE